MSNQVLARHSVAENIHNQGLVQEIQGNLGEARALFLSALDSIGDENVNSDSPVGQSLSVQRARIHRDLGFTYVRAAVAESPLPDADNSSDAFRKAESHLMTSSIYTGQYIDAPRNFGPSVGRGVDRGDILGELFAEHGATLGLLARMGTAEQVIVGADYKDVQRASSYYTLAYYMLRNGNHGYYRVSNAMNAARHARINRQVVVSWVGLAEKDLAWTAVHDRENLGAAALTNGSRMRFLVSRSKAIESVVSAP